MVLFLSIAGSSCTDDNSTAPGGAKTMLNLSYGTDPYQKLDLYLPANANANTPLLILLHGGGWFSGDKNDLTPYVESLKASMPDWAFANVNYRLANISGNWFPAQETDVLSAIQYMSSNRADWGISDKWSILGASAGGHLAMLQAYKKQGPVKMRSVVNYYGPSDLVELYNNPPGSWFNPTLIAMMMQGTPTENPTLWQSSSPINYIDAQTQPTITFQGSVDSIVPASQQQALHLKLNSFQVTNSLHMYPGAGHGFYGNDFNDSYLKTVAFLQQYGR